MKNLLYYQQNTTFGLTERYLFDLARSVDRSKYNVHVMFPDVPELRQFESLSSWDISLHRTSEGLLTSNILRSVPRMLPIFRHIHPDLIHFNDPVLAGLVAGQLHRHASLVMTHHTPELDRGYSWKGRLLEKLAFRKRPFVIFTSENDLRTGVVRDGFREDNCTVVPYGIDVASFSRHSCRRSILQELGIPSEHRIIGNVARLVPQKGHEYLIAAARIVLSQRDDVSFLVVGSGSLIDELSSKVEHAGISQRFVFTGQRSDVPLVLSACDLFVLPSLFEGLCMAVLEAFAAGVPVVATKVGGIPSTVVEGETGTLVPPGDVEALAEAIIWMLGNPELARKMGLRGKRRVEKRFTIDAMITRTEAVYELHLSRRKNQIG